MTRALTVEDRLDRLQAFAEIRALPARYAEAFAWQDWAALVELYPVDVHVSRGVTGREALRAAFEKAMGIGTSGRTVAVASLHIGTHVIDIDGPDRAHGSVYCHGEMQRGDGSWYHQAIQYLDVYVRRDGRWYFEGRRRHELFYGVDPGQRPIGLPAAEWPSNDTGIGTAPYDLVTWQEFWSGEAADRETERTR